MKVRLPTYTRFFVYCTLSTFCIYILSELAYLRFFHMAGDSAGYVDLINRVSKYGDMRSNVFMSPYPLFDLMGKSAPQYCASDYDNKYLGTSFYHLHSYLIVYLFSIIHKILGINTVLLASYINGIATFITLSCTFKISRKYKLSKIESISIVLAFAFFTPLIGSISGQFYYDRLFIPMALLGFYYVIFYEGKYKSTIIILILIFTSLISERSALMIGIFFIYLNTTNKCTINYKLILISTIPIIYYFFWNKYIQSGIYLNNTSLLQVISNINMLFDFESEYSNLSIKFLTVILPLLAVSIFSKSFFYICLIFIAPNLIISVGGAEKIGYISHYHSFYIPILIIGVIIGYANIKFKFKSKFTIIILLILISINFYLSFGKQFVVSPTLTHGLLSDSRLLIKDSDIRATSDNRKKLLSELIQGINRDSTISASEFIMPILVNFDFENIRYFPIGIYDSDYIITESATSNEEFLLTIVADQPEKNRIEKCIHQILLGRYNEYRSAEIGAIKYILWKIK